jgi:tyrosine-protein kinase Etk/Wzc
VVSQTNKRVLLIDCDMRKGYTHELLGTNNVNGLSEILLGKGRSARAQTDLDAEI